MTLTAHPVEQERLSPTQIKRLKQKLGGFSVPVVNKDTTEHQAGFMLGIQYVLHILEAGWETS